MVKMQSVIIPDDLWLRIQAVQGRRSFNAIVREALAAWIAQEEQKPQN